MGDRPQQQQCYSRTTTNSKSSAVLYGAADDDEDFEDNTDSDDDQSQSQRSNNTKSNKNVIFGASDDIGATDRQIKGAAVLAGGIAGALVGCPFTAVTVAAGAAYAAAKQECEIGEAARMAGDKVADGAEYLLHNKALSKTIEGYSQRRSQRRLQKQERQSNRQKTDTTTTTTTSSKRQLVKECSMRAANQIKDRANGIKDKASQVKNRVSNSLQQKIIRRRKPKNVEGDETEVFQDCLEGDDNQEFMEDESYSSSRRSGDDNEDGEDFQDANEQQEPEMAG